MNQILRGFRRGAVKAVSGRAFVAHLHQKSHVSRAGERGSRGNRGAGGAAGRRGMSSGGGDEAFGARLSSLLNESAVASTIGIAHKTGLLGAMIERAGTSHTAAEWSQMSGVSERYVEEMFGVLVSGKVVDMATAGDGGGGGGKKGDVFSLPDARAHALKGMGVYFQELPILHACAFNQLCDAAKDGSGLAHSHYAPFHKWMGELSVGKHNRLLLDTFLPSISQGTVVDTLNKGNAKVLDAGCGEGTCILLMAERWPNCHFIGADINDASLEAARQQAKDKGLKNAEFIKVDLNFPSGSISGSGIDSHGGSFDVVFAFDCIHDLAAPDTALKGCAELLKTTGVMCMVDIKAHTGIQGNVTHSMAPFLYAVSLLHCMPVGLHGGGKGLGMMWGREKAHNMLLEAGFSSVDEEEMEFDSFNLNYLCRK